MYTVYKHTAPNGKVYIGITSQKPEKRWDNGNGYKQNKHFYSAIRKYGWENFKHEIICQAPMSAAQAGAIEKSFIALYDSTHPDKGYNISIGGEYGALGIHHSAEARAKMSKAHKGKKHSAEWRRKIGEANKRRHLSDETRRKISEANKNPSAETRKKMSEAHKGKQNLSKGKHLSVETRRKISETKRNGIVPNRKQIICVETGHKYPSIAKAAEVIGVSAPFISRVLHGIRPTAGGYHWKYADDRR